MDWAKTTARWDKKLLVLGFGATYTRGFTVVESDLFAVTLVTWGTDLPHPHQVGMCGAYCEKYVCSVLTHHIQGISFANGISHLYLNQSLPNLHDFCKVSLDFSDFFYDISRIISQNGHEDLKF